MDRQQILLAKALEVANVPLEVTTFDDRLILQKVVYLLQSAGIHIGYRFRWYLRGPYSPEMTAGAFGILREGEAAQRELAGWELDPKSKTRIAELKSLLTNGAESKQGLARKLELFASVLFLINTGQVAATDVEKITTILKKNEKHYDAKDVRIAVKELREHGLLT
jgi:uncharacterized protein YwgA